MLPTRHWELDEHGQPTQKIGETRRRAEFITPIPKPKKRKKATQEEIRKAYYRRMLKYHPDKHKDGVHPLYYTIQEAYTCLTDEDEKMKYDYINGFDDDD